MNIDSGLVSKNKNISQDTQVSNVKASSVDKSFKEELVDLGNTDVVGEDIASGVQQFPTLLNSYKILEIPQEPTNVEVEELNDVIRQFSMPKIDSNQSILVQMDEVCSNESNKPAQSDVIKNEEQEFQPQMFNDMNINKPQEKMQELKSDINFAQNGGEAFSSFLGQNSFKESAEELAEDNSVLSDMAENLAMVNRAMAIPSNQKMQEAEEVGVVVDRTIDSKSLNLTTDDVNFFVNLVHNNTHMEDVGIEEQKSVRVSETLAKMLSESMRNNNAFRLNFDNDISIIIKVSREGRISAHFLPGSDAAEAYLRNNLSTLVQRFEEENIPYDELSHQKQKRNNDEQQNKKDKK